MQTIAIEGKKRTDLGTSASKAIRREDSVPCVIYGGDEVTHFFAHKNAFAKLVYSAEFKLAEVDIEGKKYSTIMKDLQFHPVTDEIMHIDFIELIPGKKVKAQVPIRITGTSPGIKSGGKLQQSMRTAKVFATPENLVDHVTVDISHLELGFAVRVRDIKPVEGVEILNVPATPVASVEIPRALRSAMQETTEEDAAEE